MSETGRVPSLASARADKAGDSRLWSAEDMLVDLLNRVRCGEVSADEIAVHWFTRKPDGTRRHGYQVAGVTYPSHIALLETGKVRVIKEWTEW